MSPSSPPLPLVGLESGVSLAMPKAEDEPGVWTICVIFVSVACVIIAASDWIYLLFNHFLGAFPLLICCSVCCACCACCCSWLEEDEPSPSLSSLARSSSGARSQRPASASTPIAGAATGTVGRQHSRHPLAAPSGESVAKRRRGDNLARAPQTDPGFPPGSNTVGRRDAIIRKFGVPTECLLRSQDFSYASRGEAGNKYARGGREYVPPFGFDKLGLSTVRVQDADFLDMSSGWHVAYHGTDPAVVPAIVRQGLKPRGGLPRPKHGALYGHGVYCSPYPSFAQKYAGHVRINDEQTEVILMVRVRPGSYIEHQDGRIWLVPREDDIRCVAMLFKRP